ncbi:hypothetical protein HAX54_026546 [Datura stramonium]|uniref:Uncharacterized protein n=1 Tax=Datura stramonium TaxID=4076 RepID=A0ABS8Y707_DATST|nr:hypothetical protein [Datura stramonium]
MEQMWVRAGCTTQSKTHCTTQHLIDRVIGTAQGSQTLVAQRLLQQTVGSPNGLLKLVIVRSSAPKPLVTTRVKPKSQEAASATASPPLSKKGGEEAESDGDNAPANNANGSNDDAEESGDKDIEVEESGDKESAAEKSREYVEDSEPTTTPEARSKRWFVHGSRDVYYAGFALNEKGNPNCSIQEEPNI